MTWLTWLAFGGAVALFLLVKRLSLVRPDVARGCLKEGAPVIDVRTESEFRARHLPKAINIPLDRLSEEILRRAPDKEQPILLHCLSGGRSGIAKGILKRMGYRRALNLGSYGRAERILAG